ncbi:hypothetical protein HYQ45_006526 [Verticillium longisporum]|uniref:Pyrroloquinoline quinone-dependent pyranose dehydrogenase beta-propeller domain-containing protein n=1 Tax=Verticillium longisporum TaxID=100787 RepID=A0A8I2ZR77_VERLO|nr:hypothetical protein HYQ45_006526 [Verticillium longisporum]
MGLQPRGVGPSLRTAGPLSQSPELNHGIALSNDGRTLYASTPDKVFAWVYDPVIGKVSENNKTVIKDMYNAGHTSRTLLMSDKTPGLLVVSRGSEGNVDAMALRRASGHSQLRTLGTSGHRVHARWIGGFCHVSRQLEPRKSGRLRSF